MHLLAERVVFRWWWFWVFWRRESRLVMTEMSPLNSPTFLLSSRLQSVGKGGHHIFKNELICSTKPTSTMLSPIWIECTYTPGTCRWIILITPPMLNGLQQESPGRTNRGHAKVRILGQRCADPTTLSSKTFGFSTHQARAKWRWAAGQRHTWGQEWPKAGDEWPPWCTRNKLYKTSKKRTNRFWILSFCTKTQKKIAQILIQNFDIVFLCPVFFLLPNPEHNT